MDKNPWPGRGQPDWPGRRDAILEEISAFARVCKRVTPSLSLSLFLLLDALPPSLPLPAGLSESAGDKFRSSLTNSARQAAREVKTQSLLHAFDSGEGRTARKDGRNFKEGRVAAGWIAGHALTRTRGRGTEQGDPRHVGGRARARTERNECTETDYCRDIFARRSVGPTHDARMNTNCTSGTTEGRTDA